MTRLTYRCTALALATLVLFVARTADAEDVCPRTPQWGQVPPFWDPDPITTSAKKQLLVRYDGRWAGAAQLPLDNGSSGARARILDGTDNALYVSIEIDSTANDREVFWFGYAPATLADSNGATLIEISMRPDGTQPTPQFQVWDQQTIKCDAVTCPPGSTCGAPCPALPIGGKASYRVLRGVAPVGGLSQFVWDGTAFDNTVAAQSWIIPAAGPGPRVWHSPLYTAAAGPPTGATLMLRIPKTVFGSPVTDHKIWLSAAACTSLGSGPIGCASQGNWPSAGEVIEASANTYSAPAVSDWALLHLTGATACPAVSTLAEAGVQNGAAYAPAAPFTWPQRMHLDNNGNPADDPPNFFAARTAMTLNTVADRYKARFFIADWGSQIGNLDISQWFEIGQASNPGVSGGTPTTPVTEHLVLRWPPTSMTAADHKILACKYSDCNSTYPGCPYPTGASPDPCAGIPGARTHKPHQCTQVRLEGGAPAGGSYQFANDAMIFNTDFVGASVFWRIATISMAGIAKDKPAPGPAPAGGREVFLYVRSSNLPETGDEIPATKILDRLEQIAAAGGKPPSPNMREPKEAAFAKNLREAHGPSGNNIEPKPDQQQKVNDLVRRMPVDTARVVAPTLEILAYYDTSRVMDTHPGKTYRWLQPMTSFRYVVAHVGKIKGWAWALDGAEPLGGNWFRVRVADDKKLPIRTRIQAVEDARMPPGNPVWPPGKAWVNQGGIKPGSIKVNVKKKGGCSVTGDDASGTATIVVLFATLAWIGRRRRRS